MMTEANKLGMTEAMVGSPSQTLLRVGDRVRLLERAQVSNHLKGAEGVLTWLGGMYDHKRHLECQVTVIGFGESEPSLVSTFTDCVKSLDRSVDISLRQLQLEQFAWQERNFPQSDLLQATLGVSEEAGELCHSVLKLTQGIRGTREEHLANIKDAVADCIVFLSQVCNKTGISLQDCINETWPQVRARDWKAFPKNGLTE
jgi:NTP pyrophosphatase (non-canonical NTP hydrolase)